MLKKLKLRPLIILLVCLVVVLSLLITDILISQHVTKTIKEDKEEKAKVIARIVAKDDTVRQGLLSEERAPAIQSYTADILETADVLFIVVMDMEGIRKSHPNEENIGRPFEGGDELAVLAGEESTSISKGTMVTSLRTFTPVYDDQGNQIGAVAVGISLNKVEESVLASHGKLLIGSLFGLIAGIIGAIMIAAYIKRTLYGLEPFAIAKILQERDTMLQSVHEGIIAVDKDARIVLVNKSALAIFKKAGLQGNPIGMKVNEYMPSSRLESVLASGTPELDEELEINGLSCLVNRVPLQVDGQVVGAISTFRDKTEVDLLAEQLTGVKSYAEALRAQSHEFMNKLQVILGMVRLKKYDQLTGFINETVQNRHKEIGVVTTNIENPVLSGFILGKLSYARESGVELSINTKTKISEVPSDTIHELITILGNLIDNGIEAVKNRDIKKVNVTLSANANTLTIAVEDTGIGINDMVLKSIFSKGYSTKGPNRGYGLFLLKKSVDKLGGTVVVDTFQNKGTTFQIDIPNRGEQR
ncbi:DcuS/MalK family sensor histidine kinase [Sutcliffiella horikoshii]|uniref:histidine kinase n=1 Tax=Sutcliffiella horikoshii TaxID=79883 RepID=A0A5D4SMX2_9BACI|nr:DcuS/MalK family sensor histidine kinase [Sutcliffiella horikoshii]TYS63558.1 two-component system sensor histidine kinase DcuS [Sutcliffiella horikoshii]